MIHLVAAFLSGTMVDVLATLVFHYTNKNNSLAAATLNTILTGCVLYVFVDISRDYKIALPYLLGIWLGGIIGIKLKVALENT